MTYLLSTILLLLVILYLIYYFFYSGQQAQTLISDITPLNNKKDILFSDQTKNILLASSGSTVCGFFKLNGGDRTFKIQQSFTPILQVENNWYLEISPMPNKGTSARLRVKTSGGNEIIELPTIPQQKWVFIAILRDGRRFDVIYDNQIVTSERLINYPVVINSSLSIGNNGIDGSVANLIIKGSRMSPIEIERLRSSMINTNGELIQDSIFSKSLSMLSFNISAKCPPGFPCDSNIKSPNNLLEWNTPYA
jgi:hypothetical protein